MYRSNVQCSAMKNERTKDCRTTQHNFYNINIATCFDLKSEAEACSSILLLLGTELPLVVESFGLLNDIFPVPSILDAGYPVFNLHLANILFDVILQSVLGSSL